MPEATPNWASHARNPAIRTLAEIVSNTAQAGANWRLILRVPGWTGFQPGQFVMLSPGPLLGVDRSDPLLPRPMAIFRADDSDGTAHVEVLYKVTGRGTALLAKAVARQRVSIVGPLGTPFPLPEPNERIVVVAGGTGIASIYELAARLSSAHRVLVLLGARSARDLMAREDFEKLAVELAISTEDGSLGKVGLVTDLLTAALEGTERTRVYTCGPTAMMRLCAKVAAGAAVPCVAALENTMACGFGVCLGCAAPLVTGGFALVCRDGPAFDAASIDWEGLP